MQRRTFFELTEDTRDARWRRKVIGLDEKGTGRVYNVDDPRAAEACARYERLVLSRDVEPSPAQPQFRN